MLEVTVAPRPLWSDLYAKLEEDRPPYERLDRGTGPATDIGELLSARPDHDPFLALPLDVHGRADQSLVPLASGLAPLRHFDMDAVRQLGAQLLVAGLPHHLARDEAQIQIRKVVGVVEEGLRGKPLAQTREEIREPLARHGAQPETVRPDNQLSPRPLASIELFDRHLIALRQEQDQR